MKTILGLFLFFWFIKVALFWGDNDWLAAKEDLCKIMNQVRKKQDTRPTHAEC